MSALHVRNVPESLLAALRERAERHGHSMQQEVLKILEARSSPLNVGDLERFGGLTSIIDLART